MYGVEKQGGNEYVFFAPPEIYQISSNRKLARGFEFTIRKVKGEFAIALTGNGQEHQDEGNVDGDGYRELMEQSLRDTVEVTKAVNPVQWDVDSIRAVALSLFID
jgi:hypothetical protein